MTMWSRLRSWVRDNLRRSRMENEMDAELWFHIETYAEDLMRRGVPAEEARRRARLEFGGIENAKEECREARGVHIVEIFLAGFALWRALDAALAGFHGTVRCSHCALGIGANTAIFTAFDALVLRPLPVKDPDTLAAFLRVSPGGRDKRFSYPDYVYYRDHNRSFSELSCLRLAWRSLLPTCLSSVPGSRPEWPERSVSSARTAPGKRSTDSFRLFPAIISRCWEQLLC